MKFPVPTARCAGHSGRGWKSRMKKKRSSFRNCVFCFCCAVGWY